MTAQTVPLPYFKDQYEHLALLVEGITVDSVAEFDLMTCRADEPAEDVLDRMNDNYIDQMPVDPERAFYVVRESLEGAQSVRDAELKPFATPDLIAAGTPLATAYPLFLGERFLFVLQGTRVEGILTRGDFQRAPFRIYLFGLLSLLEMGITRLVLETYGDDGWRKLDDAEKAVKQADKWYRRTKTPGEEPRTHFEVVSLALKLDVLGKAERALEMLDEESQDLILRLDPHEVKTLRDNLAHAKDLTEEFPERWQQIFALATALEKAAKAVTAP